MKVERKQQKFEPVVITVESEDELHYLWHCLNLEKDTVFEWSDSGNVPYPEKVNDMNIFIELDKIVRPNQH
jgi:hypothetical protein